MKIRELIADPRCELTVAIEGPDRVGKQTQVNLLGQRLAQQRGWKKTGLVEAPIKDDWTHKRIYEMLRDGRAVQFPSAFQGLQIANRLLYQTRYVKEWLNNYDALIFDRWNASSYAYGRAAGLSRDEIMCTLDLVADPDIVIVLDGPPFPKQNLDDYEKDLDFQNDVRKYYQEWAKGLPKGNRVYIVDSNDTPSAVHATIWDIVTDFIPTLYDNVVDMSLYKKDED